MIFLRFPYLGGGILGWLRLIVLGAPCGQRLLRSEGGDTRVAGEGERWKGEVAWGEGLGEKGRAGLSKRGVLRHDLAGFETFCYDLGGGGGASLAGSP
jgi:hypothetical protein